MRLMNSEPGITLLVTISCYWLPLSVSSADSAIRLREEFPGGFRCVLGSIRKPPSLAASPTIPCSVLWRCSVGAIWELRLFKCFRSSTDRFPSNLVANAR